MGFYQVINRRKTPWNLKETAIPKEVWERILATGLQVVKERHNP